MIKKQTYIYIHEQFFESGVQYKPQEYLFDKLVRAMSYIEYHNLNDDFFNFQDELEEELENNE
jgi:hypothetical protein